MKKKSIKSLQLNKKSISSFHATQIQGGYTDIDCTIVYTISLVICRPRKIDVSDACVTIDNEYSCHCTVA